MNPKTTLFVCLLLAAMELPAAVDLTETFTPAAGTIPEGNPVPEDFAGVINAASPDQTVASLVVLLNVTGGYNGDLYAFLVSPNGTRVTLLDQPGTSVNDFGAGGAGLNITFADQALNNIQNETSDLALNGSYQPAQPLQYFAGSPVNGSWSLYFADLGSGAGNPNLNSWSLEITLVPEPVNPSLAIFLGVIMGLGGLRQWLRRRSAGPGSNSD